MSRRKSELRSSEHIFSSATRFSTHNTPKKKSISLTLSSRQIYKRWLRWFRPPHSCLSSGWSSQTIRCFISRVWAVIWRLFDIFWETTIVWTLQEWGVRRCMLLLGVGIIRWSRCWLIMESPIRFSICMETCPFRRHQIRRSYNYSMIQLNISISVLGTKSWILNVDNWFYHLSQVLKISSKSFNRTRIF